MREIGPILEQVRPFADLPAEERRRIAEATRRVQSTRGALLFVEGEDGEAGWIVVSGRVAMLKSSPSGKELIVELIPAGGCFGLIVLTDAVPYPLTARAQTDVEVLKIPRSAVYPLLSENPTLLKGFLSVMRERMQSCQESARAIAHDRVEVRLAAALLQLVSRFVLEQSQSGPIEVFVTRQELADLVGATLETTSRVMKGFEDAGLVSLHELKKVFILNLPGLDELARV